jgi:DNA-binding NarL/FixJ family response regulator
MSRTEDIRVLLIDDEEMSRRGLSTALDEAPGIAVVGHTTVGAEVLGAAHACRPHVIVLNTVTDGDWVGIIHSVMNGLPGPQRIRAIAVIDGGNEEQVFRAVYSGASGVLLRSMSAAELDYAVRQVAMGYSVVSPAVTSLRLVRLRALLASGGHGAVGAEALSALSAREREVLGALAAGKSNQEIAAERHLSLATVKSHVSSILAKLDVRDRVQAALIGQSFGICGE